MQAKNIFPEASISEENALAIMDDFAGGRLPDE